MVCIEFCIISWESTPYKGCSLQFVEGKSLFVIALICVHGGIMSRYPLEQCASKSTDIPIATRGLTVGDFSNGLGRILQCPVL